MRRLGSLLLALGVLVGIGGAVGLLLGMHASGIAWIVGIGLAKLTLLASGGLMAGGAILQRLARRDAQSQLEGDGRHPLT